MLSIPLSAIHQICWPDQQKSGPLRSAKTGNKKLLLMAEPARCCFIPDLTRLARCHSSSSISLTDPNDKNNWEPNFRHTLIQVEQQGKWTGDTSPLCSGSDFWMRDQISYRVLSTDFIKSLQIWSGDKSVLYESDSIFEKMVLRNFPISFGMDLCKH